jgi:DNA-binding transcriptional ArsR family regulator
VEPSDIPLKERTPADYRRASDVFKALANPNRLLIVEALGHGEKCVADLTKLVGLDISTVSNHLSVLRNAGLLVDERRRTQVFYTLKSSCVLNIFRCLEEFHASQADDSRHPSFLSD